MTLIYSILLFLTASCSSWESAVIAAKHKTTIAKMDAALEHLWIQNGCSLYRRKVIKIFPGSFCQFLDDGSFISASHTSIRLFSKAQEVVWEIKGHFHHQVNLSLDKKRILVLTSDIVKRDGKLQRDDAFLILDLDGKTIARESFHPHLLRRSLTPLNWTTLKMASLETSHFNSIYEVPENPYSNTVPWLKAGNIIVNCLMLGVFIFSPDLKKILHHRTFTFSQDHFVHDIQITANGEFLVFNNLALSKNENSHSAIQKFNGPENRMTLDFRASPPEMFYSAHSGGVQEIGDSIFFSHVVNGGYVYSQTRKEILQSIPGYLGDIIKLNPTQQLKLVDVTEFLKNSGH